MQFAAVEQFPLDFLAGLQADGGGERQREVDVESGLLALGADGLNFKRIFCLHGNKLAYRLITVDVFLADFLPPYASAGRIDERLVSVSL